MTAQRAPRKFTGRHAAMVIAGFFAVVIVVNVTMAKLALATFGGTVVDNSYVASQHFNAWLDDSAADRALGWKVELARAPNQSLEARLVDSAGAPLDHARVAVHVEHPLGAKPPQDLVLAEIAPGTYRAELGPGRWRVWLKADARGHAWHALGDVP
ncbi:FixH family protein [Novosphingobium sp.]|uniref:FixH family protein n=1 Tax=Novosphingobium sp. TaxID=1874826 RepID=UPI0025CC5887|nr:FixH family protein [Novosphingobium sp.]